MAENLKIFAKEPNIQLDYEIHTCICKKGKNLNG